MIAAGVWFATAMVQPGERGREGAAEALPRRRGLGVDHLEAAGQLRVLRFQRFRHAGAQQPHVGSAFRDVAEHLLGGILREGDGREEVVRIEPGLGDFAQVRLVRHEVFAVGGDRALPREAFDVGQIVPVGPHHHHARDALVGVGHGRRRQRPDVAYAVGLHFNEEPRAREEELHLVVPDRGFEFAGRVVRDRLDRQLRRPLLEVRHHRVLHVVEVRAVGARRLELQNPEPHARPVGDGRLRRLDRRGREDVGVDGDAEGFLGLGWARHADKADEADEARQRARRSDGNPPQRPGPAAGAAAADRGGYGGHFRGCAGGSSEGFGRPGGSGRGGRVHGASVAGSVGGRGRRGRGSVWKIRRGMRRQNRSRAVSLKADGSTVV